MNNYEQYPDYRHLEQEEYETSKNNQKLTIEDKPMVYPENHTIENARKGIRQPRVYPTYKEQDSNFLNNPNY